MSSVAVGAQTASMGLNGKEHPISFSLKKTATGKYDLNVELPPDYGFQKDAPHRLLISSKSGLVVKKADLVFSGPTHPKKSEYFEYLRPMQIILEGKGELELNAKIFYCNFKKNICIPGKVNGTINVP